MILDKESHRQLLLAAVNGLKVEWTSENDQAATETIKQIREIRTAIKHAGVHGQQDAIRVLAECATPESDPDADPEHPAAHPV